MNIWQFVGEHYIVAVILVLVAGEVITAPFKYGFRAYNRHCRTKNIAAKSWPPEYLDADGDFKEVK